MLLRFIGFLFCIGAWFVYKNGKRATDTESDVSQDNTEQPSAWPLYRVLFVAGAVLTIIGVLTGW